MAGMLDYTTEPRWTYDLNRKTSTPPLMPKKEWEGVKSGRELTEYKLPITDVQTARRNFSGYTEERFVTADDLSGRVQDTYGSTDTDSRTDEGTPGYTKINQKLTGRMKDKWANRRS